MPGNKYPFIFIPKGNNNIFKPANVVVMFFDVIGFTKKTTNDEMKECIRKIEACIADELFDNYNWNEENEKNQLILIPTGDGYAFAFHPEMKYDEILEIIKKFYCRLIKGLKFKIRMGIAKGPCQVYRDTNEKNNIFGYGINLANRIMGIALDNQILVHENLASEINIQREHKELHEVKDKTFTTKHNEKLKVFNFYGQHEGTNFGNKNDPVDPINLVQEKNR